MKLQELLGFIKNAFPDYAIDLVNCFELLNMTLNELDDGIGNRIIELHKAKDHTKIHEYVELAEDIIKYETEIKNIIKILDVEISEGDVEDVIDMENKGEPDEVRKTKQMPNYDDCIVDNKVEHSLYEDFTHKRPYGFRLNNKRLIEANTWKDMLIKVSEILIKLHEGKFLSFVDNRAMEGRKGKLISTNPTDMRKPAKVANRIFVETNLSSNSIRDLIKKILKEYGFKTEDFKVYLRADYTSLNK